MFPTLVLTSAVRWDGITARPHHIARQLAARGWPILFVEPPVTLIGPLKNKALRSQMIPNEPVKLVAEENRSITVLKPMTTLPFYHVSRSVNRFNQRFLARQIRENVPGPLVLLSNLPSSVDMLPWLAPVATFYDCVDDHGAFGGLTRSDVIEQLEADMAYSSRSVFATADALVAKMKTYHAHVHLVPNAVELAHFEQTESSSIHPLLRDMKGPRIGFVGGVGGWLDFSFLADLARQNERCQFVFIGPIETDISAIQSLPNVHFLGRQPYSSLPSFLAGFDACLYPFANNKLTESVNPVKIYEYLAAGKEVIATPTRELHKFSEFVWMTAKATEATTAIERILQGERRSDLATTKTFLRHQTWTARAEQIHQLLTAQIPPV